MFCEQCGKEIDSNQDFCDNCGNWISYGSDMTTGFIETIENKSQNGQGRALKVVAIILASLFVVLSFFTMYYMDYSVSEFGVSPLIDHLQQLLYSILHGYNFYIEAEWAVIMLLNFVAGVCLLVATIVGLNKILGKIFVLIFSCSYALLNIWRGIVIQNKSIEFDVPIDTMKYSIDVAGTLGYLFVAVVILMYIINPMTSKVLGMIACIVVVVCESIYTINDYSDAIFSEYHFYDISLMIRTLLLVGMATITMICLAKKRSLNNHI